MILQVYRLAKEWVPRFPSLSYHLADVAGDLIWLTNKRVRANIEHNQRRALGEGATEREIALSSRQVLRNLAKVYVDEFRIPALSEDEIRRSVKVHGLERLEEARSKGKGVILATAHYGAPHIVSQLLVILGYPTTIVVEHIQPEELFELVSSMRESHGLKLIAIDKPLIGLIRTLRKENGVVGLVVDRDVTGSGLRLPFLGEETQVADGAVQLALRTGAPVVVAYCRRTGKDQYEAFVEPPLYFPEKPANLEEAVREGTSQLLTKLETFIREEPGHWVMTVPPWSSESAESPVSLEATPSPDRTG